MARTGKAHDHLAAKADLAVRDSFLRTNMSSMKADVITWYLGTTIALVGMTIAAAGIFMRHLRTILSGQYRISPPERIVDANHSGLHTFGLA